jgi:hypothetical protein
MFGLGVTGRQQPSSMAIIVFENGKNAVTLEKATFDNKTPFNP